MKNYLKHEQDEKNNEDKEGKQLDSLFIFSMVLC